MAIVDIKIPQMGEGLTEVRVLEFLKRPGDSVAKDELIYTMETDKATLEVESPESGTLKEWLAEEGAILEIGAPVARIDRSDGVAAQAPTAESEPRPEPASRAAAPMRVIPPRTRAHARSLGLSDDVLGAIPSVTGKLMPSDVDAYIAASKSGGQAPVTAEAKPTASFQDRPLSERQRKLNFHLKRSSQIVISGTISRPIAWSQMREFVNRRREQEADNRPTEFQTFAFCTARAATAHPKFRCSLVREDTLREYERLNLGIAVALPEGELTTAVVYDADLMSFAQFIRAIKERIQAARAGEDQADSSVQVVLSYLGTQGVRDAVPVLVAPASAVLFLGDAYQSEGKLYANASLTFDHRLINGVEAAEMLGAIASAVEQLKSDAEPQ
jgi:pyruvate dehydrogenase E2 component (dihydrolipoamide acetyltransferase)